MTNLIMFILSLAINSFVVVYWAKYVKGKGDPSLGMGKPL